MKNNHTILFTYGGGRLANQLLNLSHFYAFWLEHKNEIDIIMLPFWNYSNLFEFGNSNPAVIFSKNNPHDLLKSVYSLLPDLNKKHNRFLFNQYIRVLHLTGCINPFYQSILKGPVPNYLNYLTGFEHNEIQLNDSFLKLIKKKNVTMLSGYPIRNWDLFNKYSNEIRTLTTIKKEFSSKADSFIQNIKSKFDLVIGVFIRQTDYKYWLSGKYYFDTSEYFNRMLQIKDLFHDKNISFVVASDELKQMENFPGLNVFFTSGSPFGNEHFIVNFSQLSKCDFILTPPSTYGVWAAFMGNVPIIPFYDTNSVIQKSDFLFNSISDSINHEYFSQAVK